MPSVAHLALLALLSGLAAIALMVGTGRRRFHALVSREVEDLFAPPAPEVGPSQLAARWDTLPDPLRRYLRYAIHAGAPAIRTARLQHDGVLRTAPNQRWLPVEGEQYFRVAEPGFVWKARGRVAPGVWVEARDRLLAGHGNMLVKLWSTLPMADASGKEIDQGARLRWLAEAMWFPYGVCGRPRLVGSDRRSLGSCYAPRQRRFGERSRGD